MAEEAAVSGGFRPDLSKWDAWRPAEVAQRLAGVDVPWYVAGGWAIDLFLGGQRREHEDLEIAVPRDRFGEVAEAFVGFDLFVIDSGLAWPLAEAADKLETTHQTWVRERETGLWRLDIFREPSDGDTWICRRDERIRLPYSEVIQRTANGIPYGRPEVILLFKARHAQLPKNEKDFADALRRLQPTRRRWLANALEHVQPGHKWLGRLA